MVHPNKDLFGCLVRVTIYPFEQPYKPPYHKTCVYTPSLQKMDMKTQILGERAYSAPRPDPPKKTRKLNLPFSRLSTLITQHNKDRLKQKGQRDVFAEAQTRKPKLEGMDERGSVAMYDAEEDDTEEAPTVAQNNTSTNTLQEKKDENETNNNLPEPTLSPSPFRSITSTAHPFDMPHVGASGSENHDESEEEEEEELYTD
jgi:hypothetical protein